MFLDELPDDSEVASAQAMILRQFDLGFHPELGLTVSAVDVNVGSRLLTGEEEEPEPLSRKIVGLKKRPRCCRR